MDPRVFQATSGSRELDKTGDDMIRLTDHVIMALASLNVF